MWPFKRKKLETRADQFVRSVVEDFHPIIIRYETGTMTWPEMADPAWREEVLKRLGTCKRLTRVSFSQPNDLDDWTFVAYRVGQLW